MIERTPLPAPGTAIDMYLYDIALSLRCLVDLMTPDPEPAATAEPVELREPQPAPKRKTRTRDELQAADADAHALDEREQ